MALSPGVPWTAAGITHRRRLLGGRQLALGLRKGCWARGTQGHTALCSHHSVHLSTVRLSTPSIHFGSFPWGRVTLARVSPTLDGTWGLPEGLWPNARGHLHADGPSQ